MAGILPDLKLFEYSSASDPNMNPATATSQLKDADIINKHSFQDSFSNLLFSIRVKVFKISMML